MSRGLVLAALMASACGGSVIIIDGGTAPAGQEDAGGSSQGGEDSGQPSGSSSGGPQVDVCPTPDPPVAGSSCGEPGQGCAYFIGSSCVALACDATAHWQYAPGGC